MNRYDQPIPWILTEASHPIALSYSRLTHDISRISPVLSLWRVQQCAQLLVRYACIIELAYRQALPDEHCHRDREILESLDRPDSHIWLDLLQKLAREADQKGWKEIGPIHNWLCGSDHAERSSDLLRALHAFEDAPVCDSSSRGPAGKSSEEDASPFLHQGFSSLNRLLSEASFLKSWPLLERSGGITRAWMGLDSPKDTAIRTPKRFEGHFVLYWGKRKFLSLTPYISFLADPSADRKPPGAAIREDLGRFFALIQAQSNTARAWVERMRVAAHLVLDKAGSLKGDTAALLESLRPFVRILASPENLRQQELSQALDAIQGTLSSHRFTQAVSGLANSLRERNLLPNEQSTENLLHFVVDQILKRSPVHVPDGLVNQFWKFFSELQEDPQIKGLMEINYDILRHFLRVYEPRLVDLINLFKETRRFQKEKQEELAGIADHLTQDFQIFQRQVRALRHIKRFFETDPGDFPAQAKIIAQMVGEFGPFFIKFAQVAAANADFLPQEIARELASFQEDVPPMPEEHVIRAIRESFGQSPRERYYGLDPSRPIRSGSIACVYLAKKPVWQKGKEVLVPVALKVARQDVAREFAVGESVLELALLSTHYWAPHSKLSPFLKAWMAQVRQWANGFEKELDFPREASNQRSFGSRASGSKIWRVPRVLGSSSRVLEMEYVHDARSVQDSLSHSRGSSGPGPEMRRRVAENFLYTILLQAFQYQEIHGDLHPGNVLVDRNGKIILIDWGNCLSLKGKLSPLIRYVQGALLADTGRLAEALIEISSDPQANQLRKHEIRAALDRTLRSKGVQPLRWLRPWRLGRLRREDIQRRIEVIPHLLSNAHQLGIAVESEYLQISRSFSAMLGTYLSLLPEDAKSQGLFLILKALAKFPGVLAMEKVHARGERIRRLLR